MTKLRNYLASKKSFLLVTLFLLVLAVPTLAASNVSFPPFQTGNGYEMTWSTIDGGGVTVGGGGYLLGSTVGQIDTGLLSGGGYTVQSGFWSGVTSPGVPPPERLHLPLIVKP